MTSKKTKPVADKRHAMTMRVCEARPRDVGRGIARIDPLEMSALGVEVGDIILIKGRRATVGKVMPNYA
ncbi:MAG: hypothetical protein NUW09_11070, partial [Deltaproteobacteria bacterium]|nr:hypothetical protein [Deltaproteobacteria bacterium]